MAKRRLSNRSATGSLLGEITEDEDNYADDTDGDSVFGGNNRRKSMMGGKNRRHSAGGSAAEQARIAEMYKTVIKLSSENVSVYQQTIREWTELLHSPWRSLLVRWPAN